MIWIQTRRGRAFDLTNPRVAQVDFAEIAFALAHLNRFTGHAGPYSVAQHCVEGCEYLLGLGERAAAWHFLLHDAHEAYLGDMATPLIAALGEATRDALDALRRRVDFAIFTAARVPPPAAAILNRVRAIYLAMLRTERDQLLGPPPGPWDRAVEGVEPLPIRLAPYDAGLAERGWRDLFASLTKDAST